MVMDDYDSTHCGSWQYVIQIPMCYSDDDIGKLLADTFNKSTLKRIIDEARYLNMILHVLDARTITCVGSRVVNLTHQTPDVERLSWILVELFRSIDRPNVKCGEEK